MKVTRLLLVAVVVLLPNAAGATHGGDHADGAGTFTNWAHCQSTDTVTFQLNATSGPSGESPSGTVGFSCSPSGIAYSGDVVCLAVNGAEAVIGISLTQSTFPALFPVGEQLSWTVLDGGPAGSGDRVSVLSTGSNCIRNTPHSPLSSGDIAVVDGAPAECANGTDDDGDGLTDFPNDPGCTSATDTTEAPNPPTGPSTESDCKNGGYLTYTNPSFRNQGQCVSYVQAQRA